MDTSGNLYARQIWVGIVSGLSILLVVLSLVLFFSVRKHKKIISSLKAEVTSLQVEKKILEVQIEKEKELVKLNMLKEKNQEEQKERTKIKKNITDIEEKEKKLKQEIGDIKKKVQEMPIKEALKEAKKVLEETL